MTHNPYLNVRISLPFCKFRLYAETRHRVSRVASSHCQSIAYVSNILCLVSTWNSVLLFHCIVLYVFLQIFYHRLYCIINFLKYMYFSVHITERNGSVFIKVVTATHTSAKICQEIIINFIPLLGFDE